MTSIGPLRTRTPEHCSRTSPSRSTPDYYDDLFWQTAHTSQRPAWTIPERWLPMLEIARQPVVPQMPWRRHRGAAPPARRPLAAGLLLAAAQPKPPPLTGPAGNGLVVMSRDGDIFTVDHGGRALRPRS